MNRRSFLPLLAAPALKGASKRPNVLFLSVDDLNDWVGYLGGYPGVQTPNIDRLAKRGASFTRAYCASPLCNPSRTALLTGLRPDTTGIYNNDQYWKPLLPDVVSLPAYFRKNGYHAAGAGKVFHHVAGFNPPSEWDEFELQQFDDPWYRRADFYPWVKKIPNPPGHPFNGITNFQGEFDWGVLPGRKASDYGDANAIQWGSRFLQRKHEKPFFLAVGLWHPHIPMFAPQEFFDKYPLDSIKLPVLPPDDFDDIPPMGKKFAAFRRQEHERILKEGKWKQAVQAYLAATSFADYMVGQMIDALEQSAYAKDTLIVFWSDNGWHLGEKEHWHKSTLWERAGRVPMVIAGPQVKPGSRGPTVSLLDLYPTLNEYCGFPTKPELEGKSLMPLLKNANAKHRPAVSTFEAGNHAVRTERWRYIRYNDGTEELYDSIADPNDWKNLAGDPKHAALKKELARWIPPKSAPSAPDRNAYDFDFATYTWRKK